jgi:hypothetical protein
MELEVIRKVKVSPKTLFLYIPTLEDRVFHDLTWHDEPVKFEGVEYHSIEEIEQAYPELFNTNSRGEKCLVLTIDVETGQVVNWPKNTPYDFIDVKIVDTGEYILLDKNGEEIAHYSGYVPECVGEGGYGDYLEFEIDSASNIPGWDFTQEHLDEFMKEAGDELYEGF